MQDISHYLASQRRRIEQHLDKLIPAHDIQHYGHLFSAARYSLLGEGKRLRPLLTLATAEALGLSSDVVLTPACTLEIVHTYSLIHDDLPCMDDDDYRRGQPTLHKKYSEGHAVLTGDYLLTYAFDILAHDPHLSLQKKVDLISTLSKRIGGEGMVGGQVMDLAYEGKKIDLSTLNLLHRYKTGALITAAIEFGGILADASKDQMTHLQKFGDSIGLAFQIIDDILDVTSSEAKHGRKIASDLLNDKSTYVTLLGLEQAQVCAQQYYDQAIHSLNQLPINSSLLISLADFIIQRKH
jgi:geranylgeranyl diphosphate synthase, type II